jgi:hypothetical protein
MCEIKIWADRGLVRSRGPPDSGHWFSHPAAGECAAAETPSAQGCTWRRRPQALVLWLGDLLNTSATGWDKRPLQVDETLGRFVRNQAALARAVGALGRHIMSTDPCAVPY